jgi:hypothetical protein
MENGKTLNIGENVARDTFASPFTCSVKTFRRFIRNYESTLYPDSLASVLSAIRSFVSSGLQRGYESYVSEAHTLSSDEATSKVVSETETLSFISQLFPRSFIESNGLYQTFVNSKMSTNTATDIVNWIDSFYKLEIKPASQHQTPSIHFLLQSCRSELQAIIDYRLDITLDGDERHDFLHDMTEQIYSCLSEHIDRLVVAEAQASQLAQQQVGSRQSGRGGGIK